MPRTADVFSPPAGTKGTPNTTIESSKYNAFVDDLTTDANAARPITAGGTGATNATAARAALGTNDAANLTTGTVNDARLPATMSSKTFTDTMIIRGNAPILEWRETDVAGTAAWYGVMDSVGLSFRYQSTGSIFLDMQPTGVFQWLGNTIWHRGNDGAGSGLDADLWRGLTPSAFVKNDGGSYTINITGSSGNAGNADNLGNQAPSFYRNADNTNAGTLNDARLPSTMSAKTVQNLVKITGNAPILQLSEDTGGGIADWFLVGDSAGLSTRYGDTGNIFLNMQPTGVFQWQGNTIWHAGNDGAGSGLDAGLLSGQGPSYYTDIPARLGYTPATVGRQVTAGVGLTGGGDLSADRALALGTPSDITNSSTNSVTASTHTHALGFVAAEVYTGSNAANLVFPLGESIIVRMTTGVDRNASVSGVYLTAGSTQSYSNTVNGTALSGVWRARGMDANTGGGNAMFKRTA